MPSGRNDMLVSVCSRTFLRGLQQDSPCHCLRKVFVIVVIVVVIFLMAARVVSKEASLIVKAVVKAVLKAVLIVIGKV
jgi:hypothetical protein